MYEKILRRAYRAALRTIAQSSRAVNKPDISQVININVIINEKIKIIAENLP